MSRSPIEPYRLCFPLGLLYGVIGASLWIVAATNGLWYPAVLHRTLMIEGFELSFVVGFLLTALPGLTHSRPTSGAEAGTAFAALALFGVFALLGWHGAAHLCTIVALLSVIVAAARRLPTASQPPPEEFVHVGLGLLFGLAGAGLLAAEAFGMAPVGPPRFTSHLLSIGMVLTLVLGVGSLLVPTFIGMRGPLEIIGIAKAHERLPRRLFHVAIALALLAAFVLEFRDEPVWGARLRAAAASVVVLLAWKLTRGPGRGDRSAWSMWGSGVFLVLGLAVAALGPHWSMAGLHIVFIGGFGLLTFAIATRAVIAHGKFGLPAEPKVLGAAVVMLLLAALTGRVLAELRPAGALHWYALSASLWVLASAMWFRAAWPRIRRVAVLTPPSGGAQSGLGPGSKRA